LEDVLELDTTGKEIVLYTFTFTGGTDGRDPSLV